MQYRLPPISLSRVLFALLLTILSALWIRSLFAQDILIHQQVKGILDYRRREFPLSQRYRDYLYEKWSRSLADQMIYTERFAARSRGEIIEYRLSSAGGALKLEYFHRPFAANEDLPIYRRPGNEFSVGTRLVSQAYQRANLDTPIDHGSTYSGIAGATGQYVSVHYFIPVALLLAFPLPRLCIRTWRHFRNRCTACNYDLRASKDRCPECGTPIPSNTSIATHV